MADQCDQCDQCGGLPSGDSRVLFGVAPEGVVGVEALVAGGAGEGARVAVQRRDVLALDGARLERGAADLAQERALR